MSASGPSGPLVECKIVISFLSISRCKYNICFGCSKEQFALEGSPEYPEHMCWFGNKKIKF